MPTAVLNSDYTAADDIVISRMSSMRDNIAMAIANERERCAKVAAGHNGRSPKDARDIAAKIRGEMPQSRPAGQ